MPSHSEIYQISDSDREQSPGVYHPYYPDTIIPHAGQVEPLIDGVTYFNDFYETIETLSGDADQQGILLMNWSFTKDFEIQPGLRLTDYLMDKSASGIDVRVLLWVNEYLISLQQEWTVPPFLDYSVPRYLWEQLDAGREWAEAQAKGFTTTINLNLDTIIELRGEPTLFDKVLANTLCHPMGSAHAKFALVFDENSAYGFTGGLDYSGNRISDSTHFNDFNGWGNENGWHDIQVKVHGHITQEFFNYYESIWNELIYLKDNAASLGYELPVLMRNGPVPATIAGTTINAQAISHRTTVMEGTFDNVVQSLRTLPHRTGSTCSRVSAFDFDFTFAPSGAYEVQLAVKKAIENAETYIYIEDQAMLSREIFSYLTARVKARPNLKVILLTGKLDPDVPQDSRNYTIPYYFLNNLEDQEKERVVIFVHHEYVHSKLFLVDDKIAIIGSAGVYNRAMFVEMEHSISFVDRDAATESIKQLRHDLWSEHFKLLPAEKSQIEGISEALSIWNPNWVLHGPSFRLPDYAADLSELPVDFRTLDSHDVPTSLVRYNVFKRDAAGNPLPASAPTFSGLNYQSSPSQFISAGADYIEDGGLPNSSDKNLTGKWIIVVSGSNENEVGRIVEHSGFTLHFMRPAQAIPFDDTSVYRVYKPFLEKADNMEGELSWPEWVYTFENGEDCGELP